MNSYEFDQPLDLRLKALNLSLSTYHQPHPHHQFHRHHTQNSLNHASTAIMSSSIGSSIASSMGSTCSINTASSYSSNSGIQNSSSNNNLMPSMPFMSHSTQQQQTQQSLGHQQNSQATQNQQQQSISPFGSLNRSHQMGQHARSSLNIHCQPLNHHQPHPLSRLHPVPSNLQQSANLGHVQQAHSPPQQTTSASTSQVTPSHHNQQQQLPPRQQNSPPQHYPYQPMPVKSLSISNHHMISPVLSLSSTPPKQVPLNQHHLNQQQQQPIGAGQNPSGNSNSNKSQLGDIPHQQLMKLSAAVSQASCSPFAQDLSYPSPPSLSPNSPNRNNNNNSTSTANNNFSIENATASHSLVSGTGGKASNCNSNDSNGNSSDSNTTPPIVRQHSLVSRYNCQPCGIVFSQPETLRAHQEGYCTKRDRTQSQIRSQSAVSPATNLIQQSTGGNSNMSK